MEPEMPVIPMYWRTEEEFMAPFKDRHSLVYQSGLRLVKMYTHRNPNTDHYSWMQGSTSGK